MMIVETPIDKDRLHGLFVELAIMWGLYRLGGSATDKKLRKEVRKLGKIMDKKQMNIIDVIGEIVSCGCEIDKMERWATGHGIPIENVRFAVSQTRPN